MPLDRIPSAALIVALALSLLAPLASEAQQAGKVWRIGVLLLSPTSLAMGAPVLEAFRQGLREAGYDEGRNIVLEYRSAEGKVDRLAGLAKELVQLRVDVIFAGVPPPALAAKQATSTTPIVFVVSDPVALGLVASLSRPGGNATGIAFEASLDQAGKQLEILKEAVPTASRVAIIRDAQASLGPYIPLVEAASQKLGVRVHRVFVREPADFDQAFAGILQAQADGVWVLGTPVVYAQRGRVAEFALKNRLPTFANFREFVDAGGLIFYGASLPDSFRRAAHHIDKILKGAKPGDLPVEQPTKFELVINLKTAKKLGLTIPPSLLLRVDQVIE